LYSAAGRGIAAVSSAIEESDLYLYLCLLYRYTTLSTRRGQRHNSFQSSHVLKTVAGF